MYYLAILFCTLFVPFTQSFYIDDRFLNDVPDYEVVPISHKISDDKLTIRIKRDGKTNDYHLNPKDSLFLGRESKVYTATNNVEHSSVDYEEIQNVLQKIDHKFYQGEETGSSVTQFRKKRGISEFHGIIDNNYVIEPLPNHLRKRRDLSETNSSIFESDAEGFINANEHIIYKQKFNNASKLPAHKLVDDEIIKIKSVSRREVKVTPDIVYPEIMLYVDDIIFKKYNHDVVKALQYILSFWNEVDSIYKQMENPKIHIYMRKIVFLKEPLPFIKKATNNLPEGRINVYKCLNAFATHLNKEQFFRPMEDYDIGLLMFRRNPVDVCGLAYLGTVCNNNNDNQINYSSGVMENWSADIGYAGIRTAAHELAHVLGTDHDFNDVTDCLNEDGYLMNSIHARKNIRLLSRCSKDSIRSTLSKDFTKCIRNNPAEYEENLNSNTKAPITSDSSTSTDCGNVKCSTDETCINGKCTITNEAENNNDENLLSKDFALWFEKSQAEIFNILSTS
ncbi:venom metalloproteinase 3-like [Leptopilina boulardi]|uniref:venom metalloproteinase 3-like n=1 Tax=Leptopilina boulardi TaxID=63433 RepID=UPI0021F6003A|nr:venom metalloproteinase 3-like [Leptopilina boulardi]